MTRSCGRARRLVALLGMAACALSPSVVRAAEPPFATLEAAGGDVMVIRLGQQQQPAPEMPLQRNDVVVTKQGRATVRFQPDGTVLRIGPDSRIQIDETAQERGVTVFFGRIWAHVVRWKEQTTRFSSNSTIAAIRGTELTFGVAVNGDETQVAVLEGHVETKTDAGSLVLNGGQVAAAKKGSAPALRAQVRPSDAVQWALYYPPVLHVASGSTTGAALEDKVRASASEYQKGNLKGALDQLAGVEAQGARDPRFLSYRASLLLATGNVEDATKDIDRALELAPNDADALALQTVMAVAGNQPDKALESARRAVAADPKSATAQTALSYARQAHFDLAGAQESLEAAVRLDPNDALAWARLAEIRSSSGHLDEALAAARKATELEPNLARTQTVLGFTYLTAGQDPRRDGGVPEGDRAGSGRPPSAPRPGSGPDPRGRTGEGPRDPRDGREPGPGPVPPAQLSGQGVLRGQAGRVWRRATSRWRRSWTPRTRRPGSTTRSPSRPPTSPWRRSRTSSRPST